MVKHNVIVCDGIKLAFLSKIKQLEESESAYKTLYQVKKVDCISQKDGGTTQVQRIVLSLLPFLYSTV